MGVLSQIPQAWGRAEGPPEVSGRAQKGRLGPKPVCVTDPGPEGQALHTACDRTRVVWGVTLRTEGGQQRPRGKEVALNTLLDAPVTSGPRVGLGLGW